MKVKLNFPESDELDNITSLTPGRVYEVLGIEADDYRIQNDDGEPYLYPPVFFTIVDAHKPEDWVVEVGEDGETYAYPPELNAPGFFEDYFDDDPDATLIFRRYLQKRQAIRHALVER